MGASLTLTSAALAGEHERVVKPGDVPKPVVDAVKRRYPKAAIARWEREVEGGKTVYEAGIRDGMNKLDVEVSPDGKILVEETTIPVEAIPAEVKKGISTSKYASWTIKRAERVVENEDADNPSYELLVGQKGAMMEVVVDKGGAIKKEEKKSPRDKD